MFHIAENNFSSDIKFSEKKVFLEGMFAILWGIFKDENDEKGIWSGIL